MGYPLALLEAQAARLEELRAMRGNDCLRVAIPVTRGRISSRPMITRDEPVPLDTPPLGGETSR